MKNSKLTMIIGIVAFVLILFVIKYSDLMLTKNGVLLNAKTLQWGISAKMGMDLHYEFFYNRKRYTSNNTFYKIRGLREFENKYFPVMYDPKMGSSQLLLYPLDFKRFNLPFPDSLKWVLQYLN